MYINAINAKQIEKTKRRDVSILSSEFAEYCTALLAKTNVNDTAGVAQSEAVASVISIQDTASTVSARPVTSDVLIERGEAMLSQLQEYYSRLLTSHNITIDDLQKMRESLLASEPQFTYNGGNERLIEIVKEIETLLAVEIAKVELKVQKNASI